MMARRLGRDAFLAWLIRQADAWPTRQAFAKQLDISPSYLSDVLNGHRPPSAKFLAAVKAREVRLFELDS